MGEKLVAYIWTLVFFFSCLGACLWHDVEKFKAATHRIIEVRP